MADSRNSELQKNPNLRTQAEDALTSGNLDLARTLAENLNQRKVIGPWDKVALGRIALADNKIEQDINWFTQAREELPSEGSILVDLASSYAAKKKWFQAAETLVVAIE